VTGPARAKDRIEKLLSDRAPGAAHITTGGRRRPIRGAPLVPARRGRAERGSASSARWRKAAGQQTPRCDAPHLPVASQGPHSVRALYAFRRVTVRQAVGPQRRQAGYHRVMSNLRAISACRDFAGTRLTPHDSLVALVMKGSPVRVRASALRNGCSAVVQSTPKTTFQSPR
jgi:hypothetical protein